MPKTENVVSNTSGIIKLKEESSELEWKSPLPTTMETVEPKKPDRQSSTWKPGNVKPLTSISTFPPTNAKTAVEIITFPTSRTSNVMPVGSPVRIVPELRLLNVLFVMEPMIKDSKPIMEVATAWPDTMTTMKAQDAQPALKQPISARLATMFPTKVESQWTRNTPVFNAKMDTFSRPITLNVLTTWLATPTITSSSTKPPINAKLAWLKGVKHVPF